MDVCGPYLTSIDLHASLPQLGFETSDPGFELGHLGVKARRFELELKRFTLREHAL
jgi:hypothetical protein